MADRTVNGTVRVLPKAELTVTVPHEGARCLLNVTRGVVCESFRISRTVAEALISAGVPYGD